MKTKRDGQWIDYPHSFGPRDLDKLAAFLDSSDGTITLREAAAGNHDPRKVAVRHDIDHNIEHAAKLADWEAAHGFRSTYYVLHTAWYYHDEPDETKACALHIQSLGHEVGIHNDTVGATWRSDDTQIEGSTVPAGNCYLAAQLMRRELTRLRSWGLEITGSAAHGTPLWREHGITNNDLWAVGYRPEDFGLEYEAYHLRRRQHYISDNHGKWTEPLQPHPHQLQLLTHPCHWNLG